jgi:hypothetical protein
MTTNRDSIMAMVRKNRTKPSAAQKNKCLDARRRLQKRIHTFQKQAKLFMEGAMDSLETSRGNHSESETEDSDYGIEEFSDDSGEGSVGDWYDSEEEAGEELEEDEGEEEEEGDEEEVRTRMTRRRPLKMTTANRETE